MKLEEKGRWCMSCQKHVIDFTAKSNEEIIDYFKTQGRSEVCGVFNDSQLNIPLDKKPLPEKIKKLISVRLFGFILTLFVTNSIISCKVSRPRMGPALRDDSGPGKASILQSIKSTCDPLEGTRTMGPVVGIDYYKLKKNEHDSTRVVAGPELPVPATENKLVLQFKAGKFSIPDSDKKKLDEISELLIKNPDAELYIAGYADSTGSERLNKKISKKRAEAVKEFFLEKKIANVIHMTWFGERDFVAENETESGRAKNRRVEISVKE
jgi:outer membrane protein OmpA-like peptidoglycan-associated protein